ncbi:MAG TPA: hypothetical protein VEW03_14215, partial [Longimicrobiaceae bacterium]|nr:hypothetical protein [Longimicrobiaceae bacterium]
NRFDAEGRPKQPGPGRLVDRAADRTVARVTVRRPALNHDFSDELLAMSRGRRTFNSLVQGATNRLGSNRSESSVASAAARGAVPIQTPGGMISVTPDPAAVRAMESRTVDVVAVDAFIREGRLGAAPPVKEDTQ